jgi:outer membrane protein assembly complex protein YaeT
VKWIILAAFFISSIPAQERWLVGDINIFGNDSIKEKELLEQMILQPERIFQKSEFTLSQLIDDIAALQEFYMRNGFFRASVGLAKLNHDSSRHRVDIFLFIDEGQQAQIDTVIISGDAIIETPGLLKSSGMEPGSPLMLDGIDSLQEELRVSLNSEGFMFADVVCGYELDSNGSMAKVNCEIDRGPLVVAGEFEFLGLDRVREEVVARELRFRSGQVLTSESIQSSIDGIYSTSLFDLAAIEPVDTFYTPAREDTVVVPVLIQVRELEQMFQVQIGGGYQSAGGFYAQVETSYRNFFGLGHRLTGSGEISSNFSGLRLTYFYPWVFSYPLDADFTAYINRREEDAFFGVFYGGEAALSGEFSEFNSFRLWNRLERVHWLRDPPGQNPDLNTFLLGLWLRRDTRDNIFMPGSAIYMHLEEQIAGPGLSWSNQFYKTIIDLRAYLGFPDRRWGISSAIVAGYVNGYGRDDRFVPPNALFYTGQDGIRPVRGYDEEEVSPVNDQEDIIGGKLALTVNAVEFRFPVYRWLGGALFADAGNIWETWGDFSPGDLRWSVGLGIRFAWPFLLLRLDYGVRLDGDWDLDGKLEIAAGLPF